MTKDSPGVELFAFVEIFRTWECVYRFLSRADQQDERDELNYEQKMRVHSVEYSSSSKTSDNSKKINWELIIIIIVGCGVRTLVVGYSF